MVEVVEWNRSHPALLMAGQHCCCPAASPITYFFWKFSGTQNAQAFLPYEAAYNFLPFRRVITGLKISL
jgi:hypothetical protein